MGLLFHRGSKPALAQQPTILHALRVQTSAYGGVVPLVFGQARMPGKLIWYGDFTPIPHTSTQAVGGKGGGGGQRTQTQTTYSYNAAVAILLAFGPIQGLYNVWDTKGKLAQQTVTENFAVPGGGGTYTVNNNANFYDDFGVGRSDSYSVNANDYGDIPRTYTGVHKTRMSRVGSSPGVGQYSRSGAAYTFSGADAGKTVAITYSYTVPDSSSNGIAGSILNLTLFLGSTGQTAWAYLTSNHPGQDLGYTNTAYIASSAIDLGNSGTLPNYTYEIIGRNAYGAGINDANPRDVINALLTDPLIGCQWPIGNLGDLTSYSNYCVSNSLFISPVIDSQRSARDIIAEILEATNSQCLFSEGVLKFVPYGDTTTIGNGAVYTPNTTPVYDLTDDDFLDNGNGDPVRILRSSHQDAYNDVKVEWLNRSNSYNPEILEEKDQSMIELYGLRPDNSRQYHFITTQGAATFAANTLLKRNVYIRKTYEFTMGWRYCLLEPMDLITLTDSRLGLNKTPVRITQIEEDEDGKLSITAEEFPWGTATATMYPKQGVTSFQPQTDADPGAINTPIIFEGSARLTRQTGYEVWMAVSGSNPNYGGCQVWISADGSSYKQIGTIWGKARTGVLTALLASSSDPDTTSTLSVNLAESAGTLGSGTVQDCDNFRTLCYIADGGGELASYQTATLTSPNHYNLGTKLRRGVFGTLPSAHANGAQFVRISLVSDSDDAIFVWEYDPSLVGQTLSFKFLPFNHFGGKIGNLVSATAYQLTLVGVKGATDQNTGVPTTDDYSTNYYLPNANFEQSSLLPAPYWPPSGVQVAYETSTPHMGTRSYKVFGGAQFAGCVGAIRYKCVPGDTFKIGGWVKSDGTGKPAIGSLFFNAAGNVIGFPGTAGTSTSTSWHFDTTVITAPANAVAFVITLVNNAVSGAGTCYFDDLVLQKQIYTGDEMVEDPTNPLTGGRRGYQALTTNNNLANGIRLGGDTGAQVFGSSGNVGIGATPTRAFDIDNGADLIVRSGGTTKVRISNGAGHEWSIASV